MRNFPNGSLPTLPINPHDTPSRAIPTATLAGAPPGNLRKELTESRGPTSSARKSISTSPKHTTAGILVFDLEAVISESFLSSYL